MRALVILAAAAMLAVSSARALDVKSPGADWTEAYHTDELVIFTKNMGEDRKIIATAEVQAPPEVVFKVVTDFEHYGDFMPYVEESRVLTRKGDNEAVTYARIAPPFVSERDYPLKVRMTRGSPSNGGVYKLEWTANSEAKPEVEGVVRVKLNEGSWLAEPLDGGKRTRLTYTLLTNPGGLIPAFVVGLSNTIAIPELFKAVKKRAADSAFRR
ncbi:MAG TPA: SRPBCC family protein [Nitrosospira sp.]